jgi:hypothetical protein
MLADTPDGYFDPLTFSQRDLTVSPSEHELDFTLGSATGTRFGTFRFDLVGLYNEGNQTRESLGYGLTASLHHRY